MSGSGSVVASSSSSGTVGPCNMDPDVDGDLDGWTPNEGDCDDCDPTVNPGAIDVALSMDGGPPMPVDRDCDGKAALPAPCDDGLLLDDTDPWSAARAIELCQVATAEPATPAERHWGVLDARWTSASGEMARMPGLQVGLQGGFGPNVHPQSGARLLALSTGHARLPDQPDACKGVTCEKVSNITPPAYFPQEVPGCEGGDIINDDVALEVSLRTPTNAAGFAFAFKFHSFEFPAWICTPYNDQFVALVSPPPAGSINGNVAFDAGKRPVSVNLAFFDTCDPATQPEFATNCGAPVNTACPMPPSPYCADGVGALAGTGFDVWGDAGATRWLVTQAPIKGGSDITVRFALWDTTDQSLDSTVLLDGFSWIPVGAPVGVSTDPVASPK
ncbi:Cell division protein FtsH [Minicystis rosea]|nr:Cell division protein FtsH [Minicystis rosea]